MQPGQVGRLTHCPDNGLPLGQGQAHTLMLGQGFAWPPQLRKHVVVLLQTSELDGISPSTVGLCGHLHGGYQDSILD
jgi:hypothetical protein